MADIDPWWLNGLLSENCNCQLLCPAHISFKQRCENDRCLGFWGVHVREGRFGHVKIEPQNAVVLYESPPFMHRGEWTVQIYLDQGADETQRKAMEKILTGEAGGPWALLAKFVAQRFESRVAPMEFVDGGAHKTLRVAGVLETTIESVQTKKSGITATIGNLFNVIHSATQYLARGSSRVSAPAFRWTTENKHALYSDFSWTGP